MKKMKLKSYVLPAAYGIMCSLLVITLLLIQTEETKEVSNINDNYTYVNSSIVSKTVPTISESSEKQVVISKPYSNEKVTIYKKYYSDNMEEGEIKNSILFYNNTYVQNTGILYKCDEEFDVLSILDGTVIDIKDDDTLGNIVEIKHENNIISTYQGLKNVSVKKNQTITQGDIIGKSGTIKVDNGLDNSMLFELIYNGKLVNPEDYYNKKINEL